MSNDNNNNKKLIHIVVQRFRSCKLLLEETTWVSVGGTEDGASSSSSTTDTTNNNSNDNNDNNENDNNNEKNNDNDNDNDNSHCGMLVYISFANGCDNTTSRSVIEDAATTVLNLPVLTRGRWGDGTSKTQSLLEQTSSANNHNNNNVSIVIVPQANLICKVKSLGKSIQYHGQIKEKSLGEKCYDCFVLCVKAKLLERQHEQTKQTLPLWYQQWRQSSSSTSTKTTTTTTTTTNTTAPDPSIPPKELFRINTEKYSAWDETTGLPTLTSSGEPLTKSAAKKCKKQYDAHVKRHAKWLEKNKTNTSNSSNDNDSVTNAATTDAPSKKNENENENENNKNTDADDTKKVLSSIDGLLDPTFCRVISGSFGMRQGLEIQSDMGPFCHVLNL